jgi:two-component system response regulator FlrC
MPPLRERAEDIPFLAERLLRRAAGALGRPGLRLSDEAKEALAAAPWPGNVRELANVIERSAILAEGGEITPDDLALLTFSQPPLGVTGSSSTIADLERAAIEQALQACNGNRRRAAAMLGIGLRTLYEKLKRYGTAEDA